VDAAHSIKYFERDVLNPNIIKLIAGAGLYGLWAALVFAGKADATPLIAAIGTGLSAVFGYHAVTTLQAVPTQTKNITIPIVPLSNDL
jgi:hypothetical protein